MWPVALWTRFWWGVATAPLNAVAAASKAESERRRTEALVAEFRAELEALGVGAPDERMFGGTDAEDDERGWR